MPQVVKSALLEYSAAQMFDLVNDIAAYPEFLPWCSGSTIFKQDEHMVEASIEISHSGLNKAFSTRNTLVRNQSIQLQLLDGPFKSLDGLWRFEALKEDACKVSLDLRYEFSSKLLAFAVGPVFSKIANTLVDAFCERAKQVYGER